MRIAIVGLGSMGRRHVQAAQSLGSEIVGVSDVSDEALETAGREFGIDTGYRFRDVPSMLAETAPDCVIIATTAPTHCEYTKAAAAAGVRFVLCEKPMATSLAECDSMIQACRESGALLAVNHQMRFMEQYAAPKRLLADPTFGGMTSMTVVGGNMGIAMNASHFVEAFRLVAGEDPAEVTAWFSPEAIGNPRGAQFEDRAGSFRAVTPAGKRLFVDVSADQGHGIQMIYCARNGTVTVDALAGEMVASSRKAEHRDLPTTRYGMTADIVRSKVGPADIVAATARSLEALEAGKGFVTGEDGKANIAVIVAAYQSAEQASRCIAVDGSLDRDRKFAWA